MAQADDTLETLMGEYKIDDVYDAADDASVIDTRSTVRTGKERFDTLQLAFGKIKQGTHGTPPCLLHTLFSSP